MQAQYAYRKGNVITWRENNLAIANRDQMAIMFSVNVLNGGTQDKLGAYDCAGTGGLGTYQPNCRMTPQQLQDAADALGPAGCALMMWRYDSDFMNKPANQAVISNIAINLYNRTRRPCTSSRTPNTPPTAAFESSCDGLGCNFTDGSTDPGGSVATRNWDFGDGSNSSLQNPSHTYAQEGTYNVTLTVTDNRGATASVSKPVTVNVSPPPNAPPTAGFSFSCTDLGCSFTDESTDSDGTVDSWSWDFGDGTSSNAQNPDHTYDTGGDFIVQLTATDNDGVSRSVTHTVTVVAPASGP
jgi:PKD repeat protein